LHIYVIYTLLFHMTPSQCLKARTLLNWTPADLARAAGVSIFTVRNFEAGKVAEGRLAPTLIKRALEGAGVWFSADDDDAVRLDAQSSS
jgi:transcriptional regulator with XRE-family HTH domain